MRRFLFFVACTAILCACSGRKPLPEVTGLVPVVFPPSSSSSLSSSASSESPDPADSAYGAKTDIGHIRVYGFSDLASPVENFADFEVTDHSVSNDNYFGDYVVQIPLGELLKAMNHPFLLFQVRVGRKIVQQESLPIETFGMPPYAHFLIRNERVACRNSEIRVTLIGKEMRKTESLQLQAVCQE